MTELANETCCQLQAQYRSEKNAYKDAKEALSDIKLEYTKVRERRELAEKARQEFNQAQKILEEKMNELEAV